MRVIIITKKLFDVLFDFFIWPVAHVISLSVLYALYAASHKGVINMILLHFLGPLMLPIFIDNQWPDRKADRWGAWAKTIKL